MSLLIRGQGKKEQIQRLLKEGKSDQEIAEQVQSTKSYVQKIKSLLKHNDTSKTGASDIEPEPITGNARISDVNKVTSVLPEHKLSSSIEVKKPLHKKDLRIIYNQFFEGRTPSKIVADTGYRYEVVEAEYKNFRKDSRFDMHTFQEEFIHTNREYIKGVGPKGEDFLSMYDKIGYLFNDQFLQLLQLIWDKVKESGINGVLNGKISPPAGWTTITCSICGKMLYGALVDGRANMGKAILQFCEVRGWGHSKCHEQQRLQKETDEEEEEYEVDE